MHGWSINERRFSKLKESCVKKVSLFKFNWGLNLKGLIKEGREEGLTRNKLKGWFEWKVFPLKRFSQRKDWFKKRPPNFLREEAPF